MEGRKIKNTIANETRKSIYQLIHDCPGIRLQRIIEAMHGNDNQALYHLRILEKRQYIRREKKGHTIQFYVRKVYRNYGYS